MSGQGERAQVCWLVAGFEFAIDVSNNSVFGEGNTTARCRP